VQGVNLRGMFLCTKHVARRLIEQGRGGRIVNIASQAAKSGFPYASAYTSSKHGVVGLTRSVAIELGPHGITVNTLSPGAIDTPMQRAGMTAETLELARSRIPLGRMGDPVECARGAVFMASELASYVTGHVLSVDGGLLMR
jgi:meso-butanediol dehydrogenase/(S,S)-butanediol dehydrogenase/diacetyl reductase